LPGRQSLAVGRRRSRPPACFDLFHFAEHFIMGDLDRDVSILKVWLCDAWQIRSRHHRL
jgi:hypothetical protein